MRLAQEVEKIQDLDVVGPVTAGKLMDAGYDSVEALAVAPVRELVDKANLEASTAIKILRAAIHTMRLVILAQSIILANTSSQYPAQ